ncbi:hypothetical protein [Pontibacillus sp. HMF3514]|uniref:hypothetical protein n=1 Tax=Pontibacillus sp. HMF3514 TaxID=2692425 RepID=UPI00131F85CD|nr:hypothetical protein [Pontibacillus sp. HMF3514]QHE51564.1 hypothetical protein GS400_05730 [Pontibacillus sp. HMF3514]
MNKLDGYTKFQLFFHVFIFLFALGVIWAYALKGFQIFYMLIGTGIALNSLYNLLKLYRNVQSHKKTLS